MKCDDVEAMSKLYEEARIEFARVASEINKGKLVSDETKRKLRESHKGKSLSEHHRRMISESHKGKKQSEETIRKRSKALKGRYGYWTGKHLSEETRKKMSEARTGLKFWNNGVKCVKARECPEGFVPGML